MPDPKTRDESPAETTDDSGIEPGTTTGDESDGADPDVRSAFREALARKQARNSHPESHLDGHTVGGISNDTRKRQFRRKSGG